MSLTLLLLNAKAREDGSLFSNITHGSLHRSTLDLQLSSLPFDFSSYLVVLGENNDQWSDNRFTAILNHSWNSSSTGDSILTAIPSVPPGDSLVIIYSDILFKRFSIPPSLANLQSSFILADSKWESRIPRRLTYDTSTIEVVKLNPDLFIQKAFQFSPDCFLDGLLEFTGVCFLTASDVDSLRDFSEHNRSSTTLTTVDLLEILRCQNRRIYSIDICDKYCQLGLDADLSRYLLGSKASALAQLRSLGLHHSVILPSYSISYSSWLSCPEDHILHILATFSCQSLVVRSSANNEDTHASSSAGKYLSELDVPVAKEPLTASIDKVFSSYLTPNPEDEVLIQEYLHCVDAGGVIFTESLGDTPSYFSINIKDLDTISVTSGRDCTQYIISHCIDHQQLPSQLKLPVLSALELMEYLGADRLDIEFAIKDHKLYLFQVRPLTIPPPSSYLPNQQESLFQTVADLQADISVTSNIYSVMTDWNPAEILGLRSSLLSRTLYKSIIGEYAWSEARVRDDYRYSSGNLFKTLFNTLYVDVKKSLISFLPSTLPEELANSLCTSAMRYLRSTPHLHDQVEFSVLPTCYDLSWDRWQEIYPDIFNDVNSSTLNDVYLDHTRKLILNPFTPLESQPPLQSLLEGVHDLSDSNLLELIARYLDLLRHSLCVNFARSARRGFVAASLLKSGKATGLLTSEDEISFYKSPDSITTKYLSDLSSLSLPRLQELYGHLRPHTYDITSPCYLDSGCLSSSGYSTVSTEPIINPDTKSFLAYASHVLSIEPTIIDTFIRRSILYRESDKYEFTKYLSAVLELIAHFGSRHDIDRESLQHADIKSLLELSTHLSLTDNHVAAFVDDLKTQQHLYTNLSQIHIPDIILDGSELILDKKLATSPTFIGTHQSSSQAFLLTPNASLTHSSLTGKCVCIPNADPGFDYIFDSNISMLLTQYGGSNSHMAIRCSELGITAAIGVGSSLFESIQPLSTIAINPLKKTLHIF